ncbi:MAG: Gfo/Idh/MocA family protein [Candidatus Brocadiia bacterium]
MSKRQRVSRRRFLGAAAAGLAAPTFIPPRAFGANERIGLGGIGPGRRGRGLLGMPGCTLVAVADVHLPRAEAVAKRAKCKAYQDYRKLLEQKDVDAVMVATPDHWHALCSIHACQAGKDVYVEKPMTLTILEGRRMVEAARKYRRIVQVGSQQRSMGANRLGCELIRNGRIGAIKKIIAHNYPSPWEGDLPAQPVPDGLDWDMWCGPTKPVPFHQDLYKPRARPGWISFRPYSGGEMTGWGSHGLDQVQWALGMDESGPVEVWTEGPEFDPPTYTEPESRSRGNRMCSKPTVFFRYPGDIVMELGNGPAGGARFVGEKGTITINRGRCASDPPELAKEPLEDPDVRLTVSNNHKGNWVACIKSREKPVADVETGHRSATVCHLGNIARWLSGRKLAWDPEKEQFPDDDEANALIDRDRRKPWVLPEKV